MFKKQDGGQRYKVMAGDTVVGYTNRKIPLIYLWSMARKARARGHFSVVEQLTFVDRQLDLFRRNDG